MTSFANSLTTNLAVTFLMLLMVFLLPWLDRVICRRLGLNLQGGVSKNSQAELLLRIRQALLYAIFGIYLLAVAYLVFFSRSATRDYHLFRKALTHISAPKEAHGRRMPRSEKLS